MKNYVIDASVAAKWFLPAATEPLSDRAAHLLQGYADDQIRFRVPDLFWAELANIFWKASRLGRWSRSDAQKALKLALDRPIITHPIRPLLDDALQIAISFDRTVYDSLYIALAIMYDIDFVTADEKLANAVAATLPVKWLGGLP